MGKYTNSTLTNDETIAYEAKIHWGIYLKAIFIFIIGLLFSSGTSPIGYLIIILSIAIALDSLIKQKTTELCITNRRVIAKFGWVKRKTFEIILDKVEGAQLDQSILGRILGYSNLVVNGTGSGITPIPFISNPEEFKKQLDTLVHENK